jgi:hypothetical protein
MGDDLRYAARALAGTPDFTAVALLVMRWAAASTRQSSASSMPSCSGRFPPASRVRSSSCTRAGVPPSGVQLGGYGMVLGFALTFAAMRLTSQIVVSIPPIDLATFIGVPAILTAGVLFGSAICVSSP